MNMFGGQVLQIQMQMNSNTEGVLFTINNRTTKKFRNPGHVGLPCPRGLVPSNVVATGSRTCVRKCKRASLLSLAEPNWCAVRRWAFALDNHTQFQRGDRIGAGILVGFPASGLKSFPTCLPAPHFLASCCFIPFMTLWASWTYLPSLYLTLHRPFGMLLSQFFWDLYLLRSTRGIK